MSHLELPLRQIRLYQHGLGYFEHQGQLEGDQTLSLSFQQEEMDDVLRSLSALDLDGGRIGGISYPARRSLADRIRQLPLRLNPEQPWNDLLLGLRGQAVRVDPTGFTGEATVIGIDTEVQDKQTLRRLLLKTQKGIRRVLWDQIISLEALEPEFDRQLTLFLELLASQPERPDRNVTIQALGEGQRRLAVSYTRPMPAWRMAYRLYLQPEGLGNLQGWALLDNVTAQDWKGVSVQLLSGAPGKSDIELDTLSDYLYSYDEDAAPEVLKDFSSLDTVGRAESGESDRQHNQQFNAFREYPYDFSQEAEQLRARVAAEAKASQAGQLVDYALDEPVSLDAGKSSLVPVLSADLTFQRILSYSLPDEAPWPQAAVRYKNNLGLVLDRGPVIVHENGVYAGEADMPVLPPGESSLLDYGEEQRVRMVCEFEGLSSSSLSYLKIEDKYIQTIWRHRKQTILEIQSRLDETVILILRYPCKANQHVVEQKDLRISRKETHFEIELSLAPGEQRRLELELDEMKGGSDLLSQYPSDLLKHIDHDRYVNLLVELQRILQPQLKARRLGEEAKAQEALIKKSEAEQKRLLEQLQALGSSEDTVSLRKRWLEQILRCEKELEHKREVHARLKAEAQTEKQALDAVLASLRLEQHFN